MPFLPQWLKLSHFSECCTGHQTAPAEWQYQSVNHRLPTCHALAHAANSEIRHKPNNKPQIKVPAILLFDLSFSKKNLYFYRWKIGCNFIGTVQGLWAVMLASQLIFFSMIRPKSVFVPGWKGPLCVPNRSSIVTTSVFYHTVFYGQCINQISYLNHKTVCLFWACITIICKTRQGWTYLNTECWVILFE